ncbi:hypothetical protein LRS05_10565 [Flavobacterium sp. J372]|uniref:DUF6602 domain-containing protein n=1 Tax=Flavobacterium sp. J372 TaxID=2898436 RepID=UPI002151A99D|nr:DUF6602 domain-containing protein [Flavobacterium sp. J372]MCR5862563.1 hypothetical protein [Flavobacterium sp. J372]MDC7217533.1 hypothetical protein [Spirochaetales bacterium]
MIQINTLADLLTKFIPQGMNEIEQAIIDENITHPVTIGTMYEGLTQEILNKSIFTSLDLQVVTNSFIEGCPTEFDVMLIEGQASKLPYSDRYVCRPDQVIAIIGVKKNLYSADMKESYGNLKLILDYYENRDLEPYMVRLLRDGFRSICRKDITSYSTLNDAEKAIYQSLRADALLPARIVWGFNGFASERNFRESLYSHLAENITTDVSNIIGHYGPHNFPNLIICNRFTMHKQNGMPFAAPLFEDGSWPFYTSSSRDAAKFFLEVLWTRLTYRFESIDPEIFGDDLVVEQVNAFMDATYGELQGHKGWHYHAFSPGEEFFKADLAYSKWLPVEIDEKQHVIIAELCRNGEIDLGSDDNIEEFVMEGNYDSLDHFITSLKNTGLVFEENQKLKLLIDKCQCVILPNGKIYAAENKSGRLSTWVQEEIKKNAAKP